MDGKRGGPESHFVGLALELSKLEVGLSPLRVLALEDAAKIHGASWNLVAFRPGEDYSGAVAVAGQPLRLEYWDFLLPVVKQIADEGTPSLSEIAFFIFTDIATIFVSSEGFRHPYS